jgi:hypothetical protein
MTLLWKEQGIYWALKNKEGHPAYPNGDVV